ncbi:hypothetical protein LINGRAHAP2_LOCUS13683 [Linum grandiflorum]
MLRRVGISLSSVRSDPFAASCHMGLTRKYSDIAVGIPTPDSRLYPYLLPPIRPLATWPLAIMALPAILNNSNNLELMWKSESEVFHIIESAITVAALRWPEKLLAQKQRIFRPYNMACRYSSTNDDGGYNSTAYNQEITKEEEEEPVYNQEITKEEEEPTKPRRRIIRIKLVKDGKPTTATTVGSGMGANLKMASDVPWSNSEEYEKKLENSKRKLKEGYSKFEDSRKRSKVCKYISVESKNHHLVSNKVTKKAAAVSLEEAKTLRLGLIDSEQFLRLRAVN